MADVGMMFTTEMMLALLAGAKTQTRRTVAPRAKAGDRIWCRETFSEDGSCVYYRADDDPSREGWDAPPGLKWKPAIHMPKRLTRHWLDVLEVRREELLDITDQDALAEGVIPHTSTSPSAAWQFRIKGKVYYGGTPRSCYLRAWYGFNGGQGNPLVTVYRFAPLELTNA